MDFRSGIDSITAGFLGAAASIVGKVRTASYRGRSMYNYIIAYTAVLQHRFPSHSFLCQWIRLLLLWRMIHACYLSFLFALRWARNAVCHQSDHLIVLMTNTVRFSGARIRIRSHGIRECAHGVLLASRAGDERVRQCHSDQFFLEFAFLRNPRISGSWGEHRALLGNWQLFHQYRRVAGVVLSTAVSSPSHQWLAVIFAFHRDNVHDFSVPSKAGFLDACIALTARHGARAEL